MTEDEWLKMTVGKLINKIPRQGKLARRRRRLVMAGVCRLKWHKLTDEMRQTVEAVEQYVDGIINLEALERVHSQHTSNHEELIAQKVRNNHFWLSAFVGHAANPYHAEIYTGWDKASRTLVEATIRDVCQPYFRWTTLDPPWRTSTVVGLADAIYADRAFDRLPILADALQDAGCEDADILAHCRGDGPHVRGCWVVDLVLGKE